MEFDGDHVDGGHADIAKNVDEVAANCKSCAVGVILYRAGWLGVTLHNLQLPEKEFLAEQMVGWWVERWAPLESAQWVAPLEVALA